jgi:hypothetical protein
MIAQLDSLQRLREVLNKFFFYIKLIFIDPGWLVLGSIKLDRC